MSAATARRKTERQRERRRAAARPQPLTEAARLAEERCCGTRRRRRLMTRRGWAIRRRGRQSGTGRTTMPSWLLRLLLLAVVCGLVLLAQWALHGGLAGP